jgi:hypothetical protein
LSFLKKLLHNDNPSKSEIEKQKLAPALCKVCCPYCKYEFSEAPSRKKKCPNCSNYIFVRKGILLTEEQVNIEDWISRVESLGITKKSFYEHQQKLSQQFGQRASFHDAAWSCLNSLLIGNINNSVRSQVLHEMAAIVREEGKNPKEYLRESAKYALLDIKSTGMITSVKVYNCNDGLVCASCRELEGKVFSIEQAQKELPVPNVCENNSGCRCWYSPIVDLEAVRDQTHKAIWKD